MMEYDIACCLYLDELLRWINHRARDGWLVKCITKVDREYTVLMERERAEEE